jgi:hypothetical protein
MTRASIPPGARAAAARAVVVRENSPSRATVAGQGQRLYLLFRPELLRRFGGATGAPAREVRHG